MTPTDHPIAGERAAEAALRARWIETRDRTHYDGCELHDARCALAVVFALLDTTRADLARHKRHLLHLLARIHRDGGHYVEGAGLDRAVQDADTEVSRWLGIDADLATAREENARLSERVEEANRVWREKVQLATEVLENRDPGTPSQSFLVRRAREVLTLYVAVHASNTRRAAEIGQLRTQLTAAEADRDALRAERDALRVAAAAAIPIMEWANMEQSPPGTYDPEIAALRRALER